MRTLRTLSTLVLSAALLAPITIGCGKEEKPAATPSAPATEAPPAEAPPADAKKDAKKVADDAAKKAEDTAKKATDAAKKATE